MWLWKRKQPKQSKETPVTDAAWKVIIQKIEAGDAELAKWYVTNCQEEER